MNEPVEAVVAAIGRALPWPGTAGVIELAEPPEGAIALLLAASAAAGEGRTVLHVARSETRAERLARAASSLAPELRVLLFPGWDCLPYDRASPSRAVMGRRVAVLGELAARPRDARLVITTIDALLQRLPPRATWANSEFRLEPGRALDELRSWLICAGYVLDERVDEPGEAAIRGEIAEVFPADAEAPVRLELDDGRVRRIRRYDPLNQRTIEDAEALLLRPASEVILPAESVASFMDAPEAAPPGSGLVGPADAPRRIGGLEHRLARCYERLETLFDYLPDALASLDPEVDERREAWLAQIADGYDIRRALQRNGGATSGHDGAPLEPRQLYLDETEWRERLAPRMVVAFRADELDGASVGALPVPRFVAAADTGRALADYVAERSRAGDRVLLTAREEAGRRRLARLAARSITAEIVDLGHWTEILALGPGAVASAALDLRSGFALPGLVVIAAGDAGLQEARPPADPRPALADGVLVSGELRPGDLVVHADHGIGRLRGLELIAEEDIPVECISLEYAGGRKLLVPVVELERIWRYGSEAAEVGLDRLGADDWRKRTLEVEAELEAAAARLLELAQQRQRTRAPEIKAPTAPYRRFAARFPFTETEDQRRAIEAALADLERGAPPMDRLVCGDVGFGKTEIALRAAFAAAMSGKQVALIAPTTVLVRQHLETFRRRFAGFGVQIEQLSRLASDAEARAVRAGIADGSVRIVIGTHALASTKVRFADLGLMIVDEEQRFGAREKARLRALGQGVHVLTLTATPIPRTLQAALAGLVDLSVIATPPVRRRPVRTFLAPFDPLIVREALRREHQRGGQSFLVCPRIQDLQPMAERLAAILPEIDMVVAHGRMKSAALDELMVRFAAGAHDLLLATDIIEAGLDLPNANTILVWRADRFGLAQLHQLRGRVGRGARQAFAYLLTDPGAPLPEATEQRLRTLEALEGLGAGFEIGARDLDLRGAGDLLGAEQAGYVRLIGTELYQRMLGRALQRARGEAVPEDGVVELNLGIPLLIPADYVPEPEIRLALYRQLGALPDEAAVTAFGEELVDRFGPLPATVAALLARAGIQLRCRRAGVARLEAGPKAIALEFRAPELLRRCAVLAGDGNGMRLRADRLIASEETASPEERLAATRRLLERVEEVTRQPGAPSR